MPKVKTKARKKSGKDDTFRHHFKSFQQELSSLKAPKYGAKLFRGATAGDAGDGGPGQDSGHFFSTLAAWRELNLSENFRGLSAKCHQLSLSLGMVIHNAAKLNQLLSASAHRELEEGSGALSLEPILELWLALARDLGGKGFAPFFPDMCSAALLATRLENVSVIQQSCSSLAGAAKILQRSSAVDEVAILRTVARECLVKAWPQPDKMPSEICVRVASVMADVVRRSAKKEILIRWLLDLARKENRLLNHVVHTLLSSSVSPFFNAATWELVVDAAFGDDDTDTALKFWTQSFEMSAEHYADSYFQLIGPVIKHVCNNWKDKPDFFLQLLHSSLANQPPTKSSSGTTGDLLTWISSHLKAMSELNVQYEIVDKVINRLLVQTASDSSANLRSRANSLVDSLLAARGQYTFEQVCGSFISAEQRLWRDALKSRLSILGLKLDTSEANLLSFARVINALLEDEDWEQALFDIPEGQPDREGSFPNKMVELLLTLLSSPSERLQDIATLVKCLSCLRPICVDSYKMACKRTQEEIRKQFQCGEEKEWKPILLNLYRGARKMFCPVSPVLNREMFLLVAEKLEDDAMSEVFRITCAADPGGVRSLLGEVDYEERLADSTLSISRTVRLNNLLSLQALQEERDDYGVMVRAESAEASVGDYRERMRLFQSAKTQVGGGDARVQRVLVQTLLCNFYENFAWLWKPTVEMAAALEADVCSDMFWRVVINMMGEAVEDEADRYDVQVNLLRVLGGLDRSLTELEVATIVQLFFKTVGADGFNTFRKGCKNVLSEYFKLFAKYCPKDTKLRNSVVDKAMEFLKDGVSEAQAAAIGFLAPNTKGVGQHKEELLNLCDKQKWKRQMRGAPEDFKKSMESNPRLRVILRKLCVGMLRRTARESSSLQKASRKIILQNAEMIDKDFLFEVVSEIVHDLNPDADGGSEWSAGTNYQMVVDLCLFGKSMMKAEHQEKANGYLATVLIQMSKQPDLFSNMRWKKRLMETLLRVSQASKDLSSGLMLDSGVIDNCVRPVFEGKKLPTKLFSVLECWIDKELFDCFFAVGSSGDHHLLSALVCVLKSEDESAVCKALNVICKLIRKAYEDADGDNGNKNQKHLPEVQKCWEQIYASLEAWLSFGKLDTDRIGDRLYTLRFSFQEGWPSKDSVDKLASLLAVKCRVLEANHAIDWLGTVGELIRRSNKDVPDCLFGCIMAFKMGEHRERLCMALSKGLGHTESSLDVSVQDLVDTRSALGRKLNLFVFYGTFSLLYKYAGTSWVQGMNLILKFLRKLLKEGREEYEYISQKCLVPQIKRGLKSKDDSIYCSCVTLLRFYLEHTSPGEQPAHFKDLVQLMDEDDDTDFFENAKHLQFHRRARIMRRVAGRLEKEELVLSATTLYQFMLPVARRYVLNTTYKDQTDLVESSIGLIGAVCARLKVDEYVRLLEGLVGRDKGEAAETKQFQKQKIDVISKILHAFSYEVSTVSDGAKRRLERLLRNLLSQMRKESVVANLHVYISVAKLSAFLSRGSCVNTIVLDLCNRLRIRFFKDREIVRKTILQVKQSLWLLSCSRH